MPTFKILLTLRTDEKPYLENIATSLYAAMHSVDLSVALHTTSWQDTTNFPSGDVVYILVGFHDYPIGQQHPVEFIRSHQCIIYQTEQLVAGGPTLPDWYIQSLKEAQAVWDYSQGNTEMLRANGIVAHTVYPGFEEVDDHLADIGAPSHDVLFYGTMNPRRHFVLQMLQGMCDVHIVEGFGPELHREMHDCRLALNIHFYPSHTIELLRLAPLLNRGVPVITEESGWNPYADGVKSVPYRDLVATVVNLLHADDMNIEGLSELEALGQRGYDTIRKHDMATLIRTALA